MTARYDDLLDDGGPSGADAWIAFAKFLNEGELLDEIAEAARTNEHARRAYAILEHAAAGAIQPLKRTLFVLDARAKP